MKVLLVDDDEELLEAITVAIHFEWRDCTIIAAVDGQEGLNAFFDHSPDLVVLDLTMPNMNGFDILREIRRVSDVPVVVLSAQQSETSHVRGLDLGADDYVTKPFTILTLLARIRALLRRAEPHSSSSGPQLATFGELRIDLREQQAWLRDERLPLTPSEFRLLYHLARNPNRVISNRVLCERVWGTEWEATANDLKALVHRLRVKLKDKPRHPRYIENQRGLGYRFLVQPDRPL